MLDKICNERKNVVDLQHCHKDIKASLLYFYRINLNSKNYSLYVVVLINLESRLKSCFFLSIHLFLSLLFFFFHVCKML